MSCVILGVTGGVAAFRAAELANSLTKAGRDVRVIMTANAQKFIAPLTFQALTGNKVYTDMFERLAEVSVEHISLAKAADAAVVAPATANIIAKLSCGIADDMLTTVLLAYPPNKPLIIAPAMNTAMYEHPATRANLATLRERGAVIVEPRESRLACGDTGRGALADIDVILKEIEDALR
jgi:phosphopantothenoylcysteine synthetase/decarboxylase